MKGLASLITSICVSFVLISGASVMLVGCSADTLSGPETYVGEGDGHNVGGEGDGHNLSAGEGDGHNLAVGEGDGHN